MSPPRPAIVAVFGGNTVGREVLDLAATLGELIAARGVVLLTGGDGTATGEVKQDAIAGARADGRWVGVVNSVGSAPSFDADDASFVLHPRIGHQRNLLEAFMCDAAVVLEGGDGTVSELVSTLCLGKPVLLVGETWASRWPDVRALFDASSGSLSTGRLVDVARARLDSSRGPMAEQVRAVVTEARLAPPALCRYADLARGAGVAAEWLDALAGAPRTGTLPAIDYFDDVRRPYERWVTIRRA